MFYPKYDRVLIIAELKGDKFSWYCVPKEHILDTIESSMDFATYDVRVERLHELCHEKGADKLSYQPALFINANEKKLYSQFPEPPSFEEHVTDSWEGYYEDFIEFIPQSERYWI